MPRENRRSDRCSGCLLLDRDDVGARHHHVVDPELAESSRLASITRSCGDSAGLCRSLSSMTSSQAFADRLRAARRAEACARRCSSVGAQPFVVRTSRRMPGVGHGAYSSIPQPSPPRHRDRQFRTRARIDFSSGSMMRAFARRFVIVAQQMQHAMDVEMQRMAANSSCRSPAASRAVCDRRSRHRRDSIRPCCRERQHVGRLGLAAELRIEGFEPRIVRRAGLSGRTADAARAAGLPRPAAGRRARRRAIPARSGAAPGCMFDHDRNGGAAHRASRPAERFADASFA